MTQDQIVELLTIAAKETYAKHRRQAAASEQDNAQQFQRTLGMDDLLKAIGVQLESVLPGFNLVDFLNAVYPPVPRAKSAVRIDTSRYVRSHMKEPRGRGSWAFAMGDSPTEPWWTPGSTTYVLAKSMAKIEARKRGVSVVFVLP